MNHLCLGANMPTATIVENAPAGTLLHWIRLDLTLDGYTKPGQFITATVPDCKPGFFAIASSPGQPIELLVKATGATAEVITAMKAGETLEISDPMGKGFPVDQVAGRELVVLINGSAISAVRPVIEAEIDRGLSRPVHLLYGVLSPAHRSFLPDLERWANAGVSVHTVVDAADSSDWSGERGYVQELAQRLGLIRDNVGVVLCGVPPMLEAAKQLYSEAGCPPECVLTNY